MMNYIWIIVFAGFIPNWTLVFRPIGDYLFPAKPDLDQEKILDCVEMVKQYGYPIEEYLVTTDDGYKLKIHRIPGSPRGRPAHPGKPAVLLHPGLFSQSDSWVLVGPKKDLAFILADEGYDVWLGNVRGTTYGRSHKYLSANDREFWRFSMHEMAVYDLAANIDFLLNISGQSSVIYVGHSMGTTLSYILLSSRPEYNKKIKLAVSLAPVAIWLEPPVSTLVRLVAYNGNLLKNVAHAFGIYNLVNQTPLKAVLGERICGDQSILQRACLNFLFSVMGPDQNQFNSSFAPHLLAHVPAGTSSFSIHHYGQNIIKKSFQAYDYGESGNLHAYGSINPPKYDLGKITAPFLLFYCDNDYFTPSAVGLIEKYGYPAEEHLVTTDDGYKIKIHRIPGKPKKPAILLQHGLLSLSDNWVLTGPGRDLAFILADEGYDVWLGNVRGNTYGRSHEKLSPTQRDFWMFSFHEMAVYDLPAMIDHILRTSGQPNILYLGHSMGTTLSYILLSTRLEYNKKIKLAISLAPIAFWIVPPTSVIATTLLAAANTIKEFTDAARIYELLPQTTTNAVLGQEICGDQSTLQEYCLELLFSFVGPDRNQFNSSFLPDMFAHIPAGTSVVTGHHYVQNIQRGTFEPYDYGYIQNFRLYGSEKPPRYELKKITTPFLIFYSNNDYLTPKANVDELVRILPSIVGVYRLQYKKFNHLDFLWALDVKEMLYNNILSFLNVF